MGAKLAPGRSEEGRKRSRDALEQLAGEFAHDFNNLLGVILNYTTFARDASPKGGSVREDLSEVLRATASATELAQRLLVFSREIEASGVVQLPTTDPLATAARTSRNSFSGYSAGDRQGAGQTILVVDDKASLRGLAERTLVGTGYSVLTADCGDAALAAVAAEGMPHLLLTDVVMPGMSGVVLASRLRQADPGLAVAYMSGYAADALAQHGDLEEAAWLLEKPFSSEVLLRSVRAALASRGGRPPAKLA